MTEPLRFGIVSTAGINDSLLEACRATGLAEVVAVSSRDAGRAAAYARDHGIPAFHAGHAGLVADPAVEAVYVSAPNALHVEWTMAAIAAGKHVLCEKPFTRRSADARAAVDAAAAAGVTLAEAFMYRHHPQIRDLAGRVAAGELGALRTMRAAFGFTADRPDDILLQPALDGGGLLDVGCYCVSALRLLAGEPEAVEAEADVGPTGVDLQLPRPDGLRRRRDRGVRVRYRHARDAPAGGASARAAPSGWTIPGWAPRPASTPTRCSSRTSSRPSARAARRWCRATRSSPRPRPWRR